MSWLTPNTPAPSTSRCRRVRLPDSIDWFAFVSGALLQLSFSYAWEQYGTMTVEQAGAIGNDIWKSFVEGEDWCMIGSMFPFASATVPGNCLECDGSTYLRVDYPDLYAALDVAFVVDADRFVVPDMRNRVALGSDFGTGTTYPVGFTGGEATHTLVGSEVPTHSHTDSGHSHIEGTTVPVPIPQGVGVPIPSAVGSIGTTLPGYASLDSFGGDGSHNNLQPYIALRWAIVSK